MLPAENQQVISRIASRSACGGVAHTQNVVPPPPSASHEGRPAISIAASRELYCEPRNTSVDGKTGSQLHDDKLKRVSLMHCIFHPYSRNIYT